MTDKTIKQDKPKWLDVELEKLYYWEVIVNENGLRATRLVKKKDDRQS